MAQSALPFTHEMVVVHKGFRREFGQGSSWVRRVTPGDTRQASVVFGHFTRAFETLHHHHVAEDVVLWPLLRQRAVGHEALLDEMESQHAGIDPALARARSTGQRWVATGDAAERDAFADSLDALARGLLAHLDQEEAEILPLAQQHLSEAEWARLSEHAIGHTPKMDLLMGIGGILEDADSDERAMMLSVMPGAAKLMYRLFGRRAYIRHATAVRGTAPVGL